MNDLLKIIVSADMLNSSRNDLEELIEKLSERIEMMFEYGEISESAYLDLSNILEEYE